MRITKKRFWQPGAGWALARAYHTDATALFLPYRRSVTPAWRFFCILGAMKQTLSHAAPSRCDRDHRIAVSADARERSWQSNPTGLTRPRLGQILQGIMPR